MIFEQQKVKEQSCIDGPLTITLDYQGQVETITKIFSNRSNKASERYAIETNSHTINSSNLLESLFSISLFIPLRK